ncbi:putative ribonuclease H-like domain-containing protein [Tanacetum coccineum]
MIIKKDSKIVKEKVERKSLALKAKKESSDEECLTSESEDEEYTMANDKSDRKCFRCGDPNHLIGECPKPPKDKNQKAFVGGSWSDSGEEDDEKVNNETCLVAQASSEDIRTGWIIRRGTEREGLYYVDEVTTSGTVMLAHGTSEREAWLWHKRLGHPSEHEEPTLLEVPEKILRGNLSKEAKALFASLYSEEAPSNVEQALKSEKWKNAMDVEMDALMRNGTWDKCILPQRKKPIGCRWIFTIKNKPDGTFDMKNAFLHGELKKEVYMEAPPGFSQHFKHKEVCKLKKSLYGLKQSPRAWFGRFTLAMKKYGYKQSNSDHTLFLSYRGDLLCDSLIIYVDDMIITGNDESEIKKLKE